MKILVALSGGVDSSVIAHLLHEQGHELIGVMMKLWTDPLAPEVERAIPTKCCSIEHIARARSVCDTLGIPFYVLNLEQEFKEDVVDPFLAEYEKGNTPNPCIECNRNIKFGKLIEKMHELGCEKLATGHYARIEEQNGHYSLLEATDKQKDQSYYLYGLSQDQLQHIMLPLGSYNKPDVFALAKTYNVPMYDGYRESQDLCFFPEKEPSSFLKRYIKSSSPGPIKNEDGTELGTHEGLPFYTIGQRKGLRLGGQKIPLYVVRKEQKSNTIFVAKDGDDHKNNLDAISCKWIEEIPPEHTEIQYEARIHSLSPKHTGTLTRTGNSIHFAFNKGLRGIAPGQSIVLYSGEKVVGGAVIDN